MKDNNRAEVLEPLATRVVKKWQTFGKKWQTFEYFKLKLFSYVMHDRQLEIKELKMNFFTFFPRYLSWS